MKNKIIIAAGAVLFAAAVLATVYEHRSRSAEDALFRANVEALVQDESNRPHGRWRTVGCGGVAFHQWNRYCCPSSFYDNCPDMGTCKASVILGCD